jgi:predicted nucleic acid-binding protein
LSVLVDTNVLLRRLEPRHPHHFALLPDDPRIYDDWRRLVVLHQIVGNRVYDARLVAVMLVHGIGPILSFNVADFVRFGVVAVHPSAVP